MWLKYLLKGFIPGVLVVVIEVLDGMAKDTEETDIDDQLVVVLKQNQEKIVQLILDKL